MSVYAHRLPDARPPDVPEIPPGQDELPYDDGEPMESPRHRQQMNLLIETLQRHYKDRPDVFIGGNMGFYFSVLQARQNDFRAPDFLAVLGARADRERKSWVVWEEDGRVPDVVIALLSPSTEPVDRGRKMQIYAGLRVPEYGLYDVATEGLELYRLNQSRYERVDPEADGDVLLSGLGLRLGVADGVYGGAPFRGLRWKTPARALLPTGDEDAAEAQARADEAQARADEARARAEAAEARAARLAEQLRALGVDPG